MKESYLTANRADMAAGRRKHDSLSEAGLQSIYNPGTGFGQLANQMRYYSEFGGGNSEFDIRSNVGSSKMSNSA